MAVTCVFPALTLVQLLLPIWTGEEKAVYLPNIPSYPQVNNVPPPLAAVCLPPALTLVQLLLPIWTGLLLGVVVPSPSCP